MFKVKFTFSITILVLFLTITSVIKNKTRIIEKQITNLNKILLTKEKNVHEAELDFYYLSSPGELEKKLNLIGFNKYQPIKYSNIFFNISEFNKIEKKFSNLKILNSEKIKKK